MPRPSLTDEQRSAIRRSIREAAAKIYAQEGVNNVSARAVAQEAGVSVGTVYSYFGSLSGLLQSLWRQPVRKLVENMTQLADETQDPAKQIEAFLSAYVRFAQDEPIVFRSAFLFVRPESVAPPEQIPLANDKFFKLFTEAVAEGQRLGAFRSGDPNTIAQIVLSSVHGALALPINLHRLALQEGKRIAEEAIAAQLEWLQSLGG